MLTQKAYAIEHPQAGPIKVRGYLVGREERFSECTQGGRLLPITADTFYGDLSEEQVLSLGGKTVPVGEHEDVIIPLSPIPNPRPPIVDTSL